MATILVIDDQEPIRTLLRAALEGDGHEVLEASNGLLGLERSRERAADLVILDLLMPEMNGLELMAELNRSLPHVKVIAMSGGLKGEGGATRSKTAGGASHASKALRAQSPTRGRSRRIGAVAATDDTSPNHRSATRVDRDVASGRRIGVKGTPTFFINGALHTDEDTLERLVLRMSERGPA